MRPTTLLPGTATGLVLVASLAVAADRRIEGTVKAVDAETFTATLATKAGATTKDETLDVVKKARISVNGQPATLNDVRRGQQAVATFNTELEVVTSLDATGEGIAPLVPEVTVVNELPEGASHSAPWLSPDGLTLYWSSLVDGERQRWIWTAQRMSKESLFEDFRRLVPGRDPTVSADGLEMILLAENAGLQVATRPTKDAAFSRPRKLLDDTGPGFLASPCLSQDGLTLYADRIVAGRSELVKLTRSNRSSAWRDLAVVALKGLDTSLLRFFDISPDGRRAFCATLENFQDPRTNNFLHFQAAPDGNGFTSPRVIRIQGQTIRGKFPRYVPATNELFFAAPRDAGPGDRLLLVRNFDPDAIETAPTAAANPARPDQEAIQGEWVSVSETISGKPLTPEQIKQMNKRMSIKGDRLVVRRTGLGGQFGVYNGTFRLDPAATPRSFAWDGTWPSGTKGGWRGLYELEGETLRLCYVETPSGKPRPTEMRSAAGSGVILVVFRRDGK